jgi:hypothetical protein
MELHCVILEGSADAADVFTVLQKEKHFSNILSITL